jgi:hypothetical protein
MITAYVNISFSFIVIRVRGRKMQEVLTVAIVFGMVSWVTWVIANAIRRGQTARTVANLHSKLLDKCTSNQELLSYLESQSGRRFLESTTTSEANPSGRILNAIQAGAITALAGGAMLIVRTEQRMDWDGREFLLICGAVLLAIGVGYLVSAAMSYVLCRSWGLFRQQ